MHANTCTNRYCRSVQKEIDDCSILLWRLLKFFLSLIGLFNFNKWNLMFRTPLYMNEDLFYYIIHFSDSENYIIARLSQTLISDRLISEISKENFYFIATKPPYGLCIQETVCNFHLENGSLLPYNAFMRLFCWDRKHFVAILIKFVLILYFKFLIWHKNINGNADTADMKGQWNNLQFFKFCVRFANNACVITWPHAFRIARKCLQSGIRTIFDVPGCRPCYARFII